MINIEAYFKVLKKTKVTQQQLLFLYCIYFKKFKYLQEYANIFPNEENAFLPRIYVEDLKTNGFIDYDVSKDNKIVNVKITTKFSNLFVDEYIAIQEVWEAYPDFLTSENKRYPLKAADPDKLAKVYFDKIGGSIEEHKNVMLDIEYMTDNNMVYCKIDTFIASKGWLSIRANRLSNDKPVSIVANTF